MTTLFLSIPLIGGVGLMAAGQKLSCDGKTTRGLLLGLLGLCFLYGCYVSASHWGVLS